MSLTSFFTDQFQQIKDFMVARKEVLRCIRVDPELKELFIKALVCMDEELENPHVVIPCDLSFEDADQYFSGLLNGIEAEYQQHAARLNQQGVRFEVPFEQSERLTPAVKFVRYVSALADSMPDFMGSIVFLLDPEEVKDEEKYSLVMGFLAENTESKWAKYLVLDQRVSPLLDGIENRVERVGAQTFYISPEEIEQQTKAAIENPSNLSPTERRQYIGLLSGFAFGKKEYDEAAKLQQEWVNLAESEGTPSEVANGYYSLGNTWLAKEDFLAAEDCFCKAIEVCLSNNINALLPLVLTNLGMTFHRQQRIDEAVQSLKIARNTFKAQNLRPGEAYVLDSLATIYQAEKRNEDAEKAWLDALSIYDGITSDAFSDVREAGRKDIIAKLERFYQATGLPNNIPEPKQSSQVKKSAER